MTDSRSHSRGIQSLPVPGHLALGPDDRELELHPADGHTADGTAFFIPWIGVLVCGDYLSPVEIPWISPGGSVEAYLATLERLQGAGGARGDDRARARPPAAARGRARAARGGRRLSPRSHSRGRRRAPAPRPPDGRATAHPRRECRKGGAGAGRLVVPQPAPERQTPAAAEREHEHAARDEGDPAVCPGAAGGGRGNNRRVRRVCRRGGHDSRAGARVSMPGARGVGFRTRRTRLVRGARRGATCARRGCRRRSWRQALAKQWGIGGSCGTAAGGLAPCPDDRDLVLLAGRRSGIDMNTGLQRRRRGERGLRSQDRQRSHN